MEWHPQRWGVLHNRFVFSFFFFFFLRTAARPSNGGVSCFLVSLFFELVHAQLIAVGRSCVILLLQARIFATGTSRTSWVSIQMRSWSQILLQKVVFYCTMEPVGAYAQKDTTVNVAPQTPRSMNVEMSTFIALSGLRNPEM